MAPRARSHAHPNPTLRTLRLRGSQRIAGHVVTRSCYVRGDVVEVHGHIGARSAVTPHAEGLGQVRWDGGHGGTQRPCVLPHGARRAQLAEEGSEVVGCPLAVGIIVVVHALQLAR